MPLSPDMDNLRESVNEGSRAVSDEAELHADAADSCLAQAAQDHTTQRKEVKMDRWTDRHDGETFGGNTRQQDPMTGPSHFQKSLIVRRDELDGLIDRAEQELQAYRLEHHMVKAALCGHDEFVGVPTMPSTSRM